MGESIDQPGVRPAPQVVRVVEVVQPARPDTGAAAAPGPAYPLPPVLAGPIPYPGAPAPVVEPPPSARPGPPSGAFARAHAFVAASEGGFQADPADAGNWTGGRCGVGECRGTNWGISAAAYPTLDIRALTKDQAALIYRRDYWDRVRGDDLPPPLALLVYDAAVNCGVGRAARMLQQALGVEQDGMIGPQTLAAVQRWHGRGGELCARCLKLRWLFHIGLPAWRTFGEGWATRLSALPFQAVQMGDG